MRCALYEFTTYLLTYSAGGIVVGRVCWIVKFVCLFINIHVAV